MSSLTYDKTGNLIGDVSESISRINWTVYGKIASITKSGNTMSYGYDAGGNRITKTVSASIRRKIVNNREAGASVSLVLLKRDFYGKKKLIELC